MTNLLSSARDIRELLSGKKKYLLQEEMLINKSYNFSSRIGTCRFLGKREGGGLKNRIFCNSNGMEDGLHVPLKCYLYNDCPITVTSSYNMLENLLNLDLFRFPQIRNAIRQ